jgi:hypothetical protein
MRRGVIGAVMTVLFAAALVGTASAKTRAYLTPKAGSPDTHFTLRFKAPDRTGKVGDIRRTDHVYVSGPHGGGCESSLTFTLKAAKRHARRRVVIKPKPAGALWCVGSYRGRIVEAETLICHGVCAGPALPVPRTIARFTFRVKKPSQSSGPTFAGLQRATFCSPVVTPKVTPQVRTYTLSWNPATDPVTPSSQMVYEIFYSSTSGGEDYSKPVATTSPGATSYTLGMSGTGPAYFVVRARDQAGLTDDNTVEHEAVSMCGA